MEAIHYIKHLKLIMDRVPISNKDLANESDVSANTVSAIRNRKPVSGRYLTQVKLGLSRACQRIQEKDLTSFIVEIGLTDEQVFQKAEFQAPDLYLFMRDSGLLTEDIARGSDKSISEKQVEQIVDGAFFSLYIAEKLMLSLAACGISDPETLIRQAELNTIVTSIVDER